MQPVYWWFRFDLTNRFVSFRGWFSTLLCEPLMTTFFPTVVPVTPGKVANRSFVVRFSWTMTTTCWIRE
jgi:hypothetical protein